MQTYIQNSSKSQINIEVPVVRFKHIGMSVYIELFRSASTCQVRLQSLWQNPLAISHVHGKDCGLSPVRDKAALLKGGGLVV